MKNIKFKSFANLSVKTSCPPVENITEIPVSQYEVNGFLAFHLILNLHLSYPFSLVYRVH